MSEMRLPSLPIDGMIANCGIRVQEQQGNWHYLVDGASVFAHPKDDIQSFKMFTAQMVFLNTCKQMDIVNSFGVSKSLVSRSVALFIKEGAGGFYKQ